MVNPENIAEWKDPNTKVWVLVGGWDAKPLGIMLRAGGPLVLLVWTTREGGLYWQKIDRAARKTRLIPLPIKEVVEWCVQNGCMTIAPDMDSLRPRYTAEVTVESIDRMIRRAQEEPT